MALSLNARFAGQAPADANNPHPPGAGIAKALEAALRTRGVSVKPAENWRDIGWVLACGDEPDTLDVAMAASGPQQWILQVATRDVPSLFGQLLRPRPTGRDRAIYELASAVDAALAALAVREVAWRWDGSPREGDPPVPPELP